MLLLIPTNFWHCLQYSSKAMYWPLQPYPSLLRGIGCAGEEILSVFKTWNNTLEMLLLPSTFLVFSEGEFLLNSQIAFFRDLFISRSPLLWHLGTRTKAELNRLDGAMMGWFQQSCFFSQGKTFTWSVRAVCLRLLFLYLSMSASELIVRETCGTFLSKRLEFFTSSADWWD